MKTAVASPDEGPDKKKYGIPPKDKKGLRKKTEYDYHSSSIKKRTTASSSSQKKEDPDYEKFKKGHKVPEGRYSGYQAPDGSWHGSPGSESAIKAHYKWSKMSPSERKQHKERHDEQKRAMQKSPKPDYKIKEGDPKPKPKNPGENSGMLNRAVEKKSYKVVENKIKKPEDKEKANKLKKTASRSKTSIRIKKKAK